VPEIFNILYEAFLKASVNYANHKNLSYLRIVSQIDKDYYTINSPQILNV